MQSGVSILKGQQQMPEAGVPNGDLLSSPQSPMMLCSPNDDSEDTFSNLDSASININLEEELEDLDPDEFELPPVEYQPTLEEILADTDEDERITDKDARRTLLEQASSRASTSASSSLSSVCLSPDHQRIPHVLRCSKVRGVTAQINSAREKINAGTPSAMAMSSSGWTAIGTTHSLILIFDSDEVLKGSLGLVNQATELGQVSSLAWTPNGKKLLVGYARGPLLLYDALRFKLLLRLDDMHAMGHAVLHVHFMHDSSMALCIDSGGSIFLLRFRRGISGLICQSQCVFSGCKGEACILRPLILPAMVYDHLAMTASLFAMATLTKVILLRLRPSVKVIFACALTGRPEYLPMLGWQFIPMNFDERRKMLDPVLAFGRDQFLYFYQVATDDTLQFKVSCLQKIELTAPMLSFCWLSSQSFAVIDSAEKLHLWDMSTVDELEELDISSCQMVYSVSDWKGLAGGGNVSPALAWAGERACYYSTWVYKGELYILGTNGIYRVQVRSWIERINSYVGRDDYAGAIRLCLSFTEGRLRAGTGLGRSGRWKNVIAERAADLVLTYIERATTSLCPGQGKIQRLIEHYKLVLPLIFNACRRLNRDDLLLNQVWVQAQSDPIAKSTYLDCLYEEILGDRQFTSSSSSSSSSQGLVTLAPEMLQELWYHLEQEGLLTQLEQCVLRIDIASLDLHQVMTICRNHRLYDGIIYVHNRALKDYITPLQAMLDELGLVLEKEDVVLSDEDIKLGNKALLYLSCCLCGRLYPMGELAKDEASKVSFQVYQFLCTDGRSDGGDSVRDDDQTPYHRYIRSFLRFDTPEFLNVMAFTFDTKEFSSDRGLFKCQKILDILLDVVLSDGRFTVLEIGALFSFVARILVQKPELCVTESKLHQLLEGLIYGDTWVYSSGFLARQQAFLDLLQSPRGQDLMDEDDLIQLAAKAQFWQVCEHMYSRRRDFSKIMDCYFNDPLRKDQVFRFFRKTMTGENLLGSETLELKNKAVESIEALVAIDAAETAEVMAEYCDSLVLKSCQRLESSNKELLLKLLEEIWEYRNLKGHASFCKSEADSEALEDSYISLLAELRPPSVVPFVRENGQFCNGRTLKTCKQFSVIDAVVFLLEKDEKIEEAFSYLLDEVQLSLAASGGNADSLREAVAFCERNSEKVNSGVRERLWFPLLDCLLEAETGADSDAIKLSLHDVIGSMLNYVDPSQLMNRLFQSSVLEGGKWEDLKPLMTTIFDNYAYQEILYDKVSSLLQTELCGLMQSLRQTQMTSLSSMSFAHNSATPVCSLCSSTFEVAAAAQRAKIGERAILFGCHRVYHSVCLDEVSSHQRGKSAEKEWICPHCKDVEMGRRPHHQGGLKLAGLKHSEISSSNQLLHREDSATLRSKGNVVPFVTSHKLSARKSLNVDLLEELSGRSSNPFAASEEDFIGEGSFSLMDAALKLAPPPLSSSP